MIPILYESTETEFISNGLGRLRDCISCEVTEERNGIYECEFEYPITGLHYSDILLGRIIAVEHDETGDIQPFDIYAYSKPFNGVVTFHAKHISYRQSGIVAACQIYFNGLIDLGFLRTFATPSNPFTYGSNVAGTGLLPCADGTPRAVKEYLGGGDGSILATFGGEYEFNKFHVQLWEKRGVDRDITIRYGVNLTEFTDEVDYSESFNACVPYWSKDGTVVKGNMVALDNYNYDGRDYCVPLDLTDRFESQPTAAGLEVLAHNYLTANQPYLPSQNIKVDFIQLKNSDEYKKFADLEKCRLCDSVKVIFPLYDMEGRFKIVKIVWDVLSEKCKEMELGNLPVSLAQALGIK